MQFFKKIIVYILIMESRLILRRYKPFIIAVTGSVGKTATKDAIFSVLAGTGHVRKSEKSMNSEIGLPLTIIGVPNAWRSVGGWMANMRAGLFLILKCHRYPEVMVLEIGADHPGDISSVARWLRPDITVITRVSTTPVHVEFFDSPEDVFQEKASLATYMKDTGTLVLFADEIKVLTIADMVKEKHVTVVTFGMNDSAQVRGSDQKILYDEEGTVSGFSFVIQMNKKSFPVTVRGIVGVTHIYPLLVAAAVAHARGLSDEIILTGLNAYQPPRGRMNIISGINGSTLIDDSYNSSPDAVVAALSTLKEIAVTGKKIIVLGDMMELGTYSSAQHRTVGTLLLGTVDHVVTVGQRSRATADQALTSGFPVDMITMCDTSLEAADLLKLLVGAGDIVLIKGSQSIRTERIVKALMHEPERALDLLVRQEQEWLDKA
jgi:UDP-N-acetylmuramoyl-tripeptide--D-alanyl-D-alanine ligase